MAPQHVQVSDTFEVIRGAETEPHRAELPAKHRGRKVVKRFVVTLMSVLTEVPHVHPGDRLECSIEHGHWRDWTSGRVGTEGHHPAPLSEEVAFLSHFPGTPVPEMWFRQVFLLTSRSEKWGPAPNWPLATFPLPVPPQSCLVTSVLIQQECP